MSLTLADVLPEAEFRAARPRLEREVLAAKSARRLTVGGNLTFLFENRLTLWWQVQEMCRVEHISDPAAIQHELDTYGGLLPGPDSLSATLLLEYPEPAERDHMLRLLRGLERHVHLRVGERVLPAVFDAEQWNEERISSVQFLRFPLGEARPAFFDLAQAAEIVVDHPALSARAAVGGVLRGALCEDLAAAAGRAN